MKPEMTKDLILSKLRYIEDEGYFVWLEREPATKGDRVFNSRFANKRAGGISVKGKYRIILLCGRFVYEHRLVWFIHNNEWPGEVDHIDGNGLNNKYANLRDVSHVVNGQNQRLAKNNKSGICGVFWYTAYGMWRSEIRVNGKNIHLGYFDYIFEAACIRRSAENRYGFHENHGKKRAL